MLCMWAWISEPVEVEACGYKVPFFDLLLYSFRIHFNRVGALVSIFCRVGVHNDVVAAVLIFKYSVC